MFYFNIDSSSAFAALDGMPEDIAIYALPIGIKAGIKLGSRHAKSILKSKIKDKKYSTGALHRSLGWVYPKKQRSKLDPYGAIGVEYGEKFYREEKRKRRDGTPYSTNPSRERPQDNFRVRRPPQYHPTQEKMKGYLEEVIERHGDDIQDQIVAGIQGKWPNILERAKKRGDRIAARNKYRRSRGIGGSRRGRRRLTPLI